MAVSIQKLPGLFLAFILMVLGLVTTYSGLANAQFDPFEASCEKTPESAICMEVEDPSGDVVAGDDGILLKVVDLLSAAVAVVSIIIIIFAGMQMALSQGDSGKVNNSRNAIIYAAIGLVIVGLARTIVIFIVSRI